VRRSWAIVAAGVGLLGIGAGSIAGAVAISKHNAPGATCTGNPCNDAVSLNNDAKVAADVSTVTFIVGGVGLGVGAFLWFGDSVAVAPGVGSLQVSGCF
jgi:hypothetical protein